jgi:DNA-binding MltR family transcriptional regulator
VSGEVLEDKDEIAAFYEQGSDRAVAVVCTAIVENRLTALLKAAMKPDDKVHEDLFRPSGPIGSLATKIKLAYMLGLIHPDVYEDLLLVTKIRNEFAHSVKITSFDDPSVKSRIGQLRALKVWKSVEQKSKAEAAASPDDSNVRLKAQILRDELETMRGAFKTCLRYYIWKLVTTTNKVTDWVAARPEPSAE